MNNLAKRPVLLAALCWVLGYAAAGQFAIPLSALMCLVILVSVIVVVWLLKVPARQWISYFLLIGIAAAYYQWVDERNVSVVPAALDRAIVSVSGTIASSVSVDGDRVSFVLKVRQMEWEQKDEGNTVVETTVITLKEKMQVSLRLQTPEEVEEVSMWRRGDHFQASGSELSAPPEARNFGGFDYKAYLVLQRIHWLISIKGTGSIRMDSNSGGEGITTVLRWNDHFRQSAGLILDNIFPQPQSGFMKSLLIGLRDDLDPQSFQQFSQLGLSHILAISGLHVGIFVSSILVLMRYLGRPKETGLFVALCIVPIYIVITGASPSVIRAGLMAMIALYAARRNMLKDGLHVVSVVGTLMLIWNPYYLYNISFQLSFVVTIGLIIFVPIFSRILPIQNKSINSAVSVAIVAQIISFPLSIYYFNQFSLMSLAANLLIVPAISLLVIPLGSISLIIGTMSISFGRWLAWPAAQLNDLVFWTVEKISGWPWFQMIWPTPSVLWILCYYAIFGWFCAILAGWKHGRSNAGSVSPASSRIADKTHHADDPVIYKPPESFGQTVHSFKWYNMAVSMICFAALLGYGYDPERWSNEGKVYFIDVGQGDAVLIRTPGNKHILIDGGGTVQFRKPGEEWKDRKDPYEIGAKLLVPLLKKRGVQQIDLLILSHAHADHYGGLQAIVEQIPVRSFLFNGTYMINDSVKTLYKTIMDKQIPMKVAKDGQRLQLDHATELEILYPFADLREQLVVTNNQNNESVVLMLTMYSYRFLFTGDMEKATENALLSRLKQVPSDYDGDGNTMGNFGLGSKVDVLKVAHHGSKTSTTPAWLDFWQPSQAVISAGQNNMYGHPHPDVVHRLQQYQVELFSTNLYGEVLYRINKREMIRLTKLSGYQ